AGASIIVYEHGTTNEIANTTTGWFLWKKGKFSIELNPGIYDLKVTAEGYETKIIEGIQINASEVKKIDVAMEPADTGILYGRVLKAGKILFRGIRGATVEAVNNDTGERFSVNTSWFGRYSLELPAGDYTVYASAEGYICATEYVTIKANERVKLNFELEKNS
ncbi:MAG TPA: carboxypeptidase regulatory-like domain-containing protein, partial [Thermoplasmatales archaeon]|nr:carboxypeptidase regulatory-like domain-containing protein [Thermoplasmatales archaeon]HEX16976.1 carboxypeptidase regulatory-like domain-containing protein [Thermoplasmatales archaeon]